MRHLWGIAALAVFSALFTTGCHKADPLVGKWQGSLGPGIQAVQDVKADGTFSAHVTGNVMGAKFALIELGTYTHNGDKVTLHRKSIEVEEAPAKLKDLITKQAEQQPADQEAQVTFSQDGKTMTVSGKGPNGKADSTTMTRVE